MFFHISIMNPRWNTICLLSKQGSCKKEVMVFQSDWGIFEISWRFQKHILNIEDLMEVHQNKENLRGITQNTCLMQNKHNVFFSNAFPLYHYVIVSMCSIGLQTQSLSLLDWPRESLKFLNEAHTSLVTWRWQQLHLERNNNVPCEWLIQFGGEWQTFVEGQLFSWRDGHI